MALDPATTVLVTSNNIYRTPVGAADIPSTAISQQYNPGDIILNAAAIPGTPPMWICTTGGSSPVFTAFPTLGSGLVASVSLTTANLEAMYTTPVSILAAPGAGKYIVVDKIIFEMNTGSVAFTGGGAVEFVYHGGSVDAASGTLPATVVTSGTASATQYYNLGPAAGGTAIPLNTGIDITNATAVFAAGNGSATVKIYYTVETA